MSSNNPNISQAFCLRWNNFQSNMLSVFDRLFKDEQFVDVTLACEGKLIKAHKMVLSASSSYFQEIFATNPCQHPVVFMKDVSLINLNQIIEFMYKGEIDVNKDEIASLLTVAEALQVRGLTQTETNVDSQPSTSKEILNQSSDKLVKRLKRRTRPESNDSLELIEETVTLKNGNKELYTPKRSRTIPVTDDTNESDNRTTDDKFHPLVIDSVRSIKNEQDEDLLSDFSSIDNGVSTLHLFCFFF